MEAIKFYMWYDSIIKKEKIWKITKSSKEIPLQKGENTNKILRGNMKEMSLSLTLNKDFSLVP